MIENNIKICRENLEMTQNYVFGVSKSTVSNWENGYDIIHLNKLIKFSNLYNYSLDYICALTKKNTEYSKLEKLNKKQVGKILKSLRNQLHLTQQQIADECGISRATYCHYEIGMNLVSTIVLYAIVKIIIYL